MSQLGGRRGCPISSSAAQATWKARSPRFCRYVWGCTFHIWLEGGAAAGCVYDDAQGHDGYVWFSVGGTGMTGASARWSRGMLDTASKAVLFCDHLIRIDTASPFSSPTPRGAGLDPARWPR